MHIEHDLRHAIENDELEIHYQPEFDSQSGRLVRFEALARWRHPLLGPVSPLKFITVAEQTGLIIPLGRWMMTRACQDALAWQGREESPVQVAVNVSSVQFSRDDFAETVVQVLEETGLASSLLQIELTESVVMPGYEETLEKMKRLQSMGITISLDDFGTGYSSLSYLPRLPFDALKIDQSFVAQLEVRADSWAMVQSLISLAHNLNMAVIAEGVETAVQMQILRDLGCDEMQGYLLGKPTPDPARYLTGQPMAEVC
jgi:EAL domain-containing protein (putative c-di-GMP-specific phosphodiesterase class I)